MGLIFKHIDFKKIQESDPGNCEYDKLCEAVKYIFNDITHVKYKDFINPAYKKIIKEIKDGKICEKVPVGWVCTSLRLLKKQEIAAIQREEKHRVDLKGSQENIDKFFENVEDNSIEYGKKPKNKKGEITNYCNNLSDEEFANVIYHMACFLDFRPFPKQYEKIVFDTIIISVFALLLASDEKFLEMMKRHLSFASFFNDIKPLKKNYDPHSFSKLCEKIGFSFEIITYELLSFAKFDCVKKITDILAKESEDKKTKMFRKAVIHCEKKFINLRNISRAVNEMPDLMKEVKACKEFDQAKWDIIIDPNDRKNLLLFDDYDACIEALISFGYKKESALKSLHKPPKCDYPPNRKKAIKKRKKTDEINLPALIEVMKGCCDNEEEKKTHDNILKKMKEQYQEI